jgi:hypothetical protein
VGFAVGLGVGEGVLVGDAAGAGSVGLDAGMPPEVTVPPGCADGEPLPPSDATASRPSGEVTGRGPDPDATTRPTSARPAHRCARR